MVNRSLVPSPLEETLKTAALPFAARSPLTVEAGSAQTAEGKKATRMARPMTTRASRDRVCFFKLLLSAELESALVQLAAARSYPL